MIWPNKKLFASCILYVWHLVGDAQEEVDESEATVEEVIVIRQWKLAGWYYWLILLAFKLIARIFLKIKVQEKKPV